MDFKQVLLASLLTISLLGCQSTDTQTVNPQISSHPSHHVYKLEFEFAQRLKVESINLSQTVSDYCAANGDLASLKQQWHRTMLAWMALQGQQRGPELALAQSWNLQFWPDKKNTTGRKMHQLIAQPKRWTQAEIAKQSVTVQGLGAMEWLLFDSASDLTTNTSTCQTAVAISHNLARNTSEIARAWHTNPWLNLDEKQWHAEYIALLSNQLDYSIKKLSRPLANFGHPRPYFAESWRSQASMKNLQANIMALQALYLADGHGIDAVLRDRGKANLADRIVNQFNTMVETWPSEQSVFVLLQTKSGYQKVYAQLNKLEQLNYLIHEEVAIELGVIIGFNATDGD